MRRLFTVVTVPCGPEQHVTVSGIYKTKYSAERAKRSMLLEIKKHRRHRNCPVSKWNSDVIVREILPYRKSLPVL